MKGFFTHAPHKKAINLPPFGGVGWFLAIQSGAHDQRPARFGTGDLPNASSGASPEPARRDGRARPWKRPLTLAAHWLRRVLDGRIHGV